MNYPDRAPGVRLITDRAVNVSAADMAPRLRGALAAPAIPSAPARPTFELVPYGETGYRLETVAPVRPEWIYGDSPTFEPARARRRAVGLFARMRARRATWRAA